MALTNFQELETRYGGETPFRISKYTNMFFHGVIAMPRGRKWTDLANRYLRRMFEAGLPIHYTRKQIRPKYLLPRTERRMATDLVPEAFTVDHFVSAFIALLVGLTLASIQFAFSVLGKPMRRRKENRRHSVKAQLSVDEILFLPMQ